MTRRRFLVAVAGATAMAQDSRILPSAFFRYSDVATEFPVLRLTDPSYTSRMPASYGRAIAKRGNFLVYSADEAGRMDAYRMDLKTGASRRITEDPDLDPHSLSLTGDDRTLFCFAGASLLRIDMGHFHSREVYRIPAGFDPGTGLGVTEDGLFAALVERKGGTHYRLRLVHLPDGSATTLAEADEEMSNPIPRPRRASVLYRRNGGLWLANHDAQQNYRLRLAGGETGPADWAPDGRTVLYLNDPADPHRLNNIREFTPDSNQDVPVADTTQYVAFGRNADASVFAGASGGKATPYVFLLIREVKRETTLCEHKASNPAEVCPVFSPNSQRVFFSSDRDGKMAIYSIQVDKLVESTDSQSKEQARRCDTSSWRLSC